MLITYYTDNEETYCKWAPSSLSAQRKAYTIYGIIMSIVFDALVVPVYLCVAVLCIACTLA